MRRAITSVCVCVCVCVCVVALKGGLVVVSSAVSSARERALGLGLLVRRNLSGLCARIKLDDGYDCALLIVNNCINIRNCHIL